MIAPKLLTHKSTGALYAFRRYNSIAYRFGKQIKVCKVKKIIGPFYKRMSRDFFERIDFFDVPEEALDNSTD